MKLISCHIENFGKLNNKDYKFNEKITLFSEDNGAGKTTLADFIKAMFYGLPAYKSNTKVFGGRQRYYPFNGGKFGGNLTFEKGGDTYRIERFFDKKSDIKDEISVFKNGVLLKNCEDIGRRIFGLDEDSFVRTAFVTAADIDGGSNPDIGEKIAGRVFEADGAGLEDALEALAKKRKSLKAARGGGGAIDLNKAKRSEVLSRIADLQNTDRALGELYIKRKGLAEEISSLEKRVEKLNENKLAAEKWATYDRLKRELDGKRGELKEIKERYTGGLPSAEEIKAAEDGYSEYVKKSGALANCGFTNYGRLSELREKFKGGVPADGEAEECGKLIESYSLLTAEADGGESGGLSANESRLSDVFRHGLPTGEELERAAAAAKKYKDSELGFRSHALAAGAKIKIAPYIAIAAAAFGLLAAGIALIFFVLVAGIVLAAVGGAALIADGALYLLKKSARPADGSAEIIRNMQESEQELRSCLTPYGYYSDSALADYSAFLKDVEDFDTLQKDREQKSATVAEKRAKAKEAYEKAEEFLRRYGYADGNLRERLDSLRTDVSEYKLLSDGQAEAESKQKALAEEKDETLGKITENLAPYGLEFTDGEALRNISDDVKTCARLEKEICAKAEEYERYGRENNLKTRALFGEEDLDGVKEELDKKIKERGLLDGNIADCEANLENLPAKLAEKERLDGIIERDTRTVKILSAAEDLLKQANQRLCDKYTKPVKESFLKYSDMIQKSLGSNVGVTPDFQLNVEFGGEIKSRLHLSAGQLAVLGLCFRFSLIENIFKDEKPFVILDDPFVNLDKTNMENTVKALKAFGGNVQIIYFCCHDSRAIHEF